MSNREEKLRALPGESRSDGLTKSAIQPRGQLAQAWDRLRRNNLALLGIGLLGFFIAIAIFAPVVTPYDPIEQHRAAEDILQPPSSKYFLGTDELGRDTFSRTIYGARPSLFIGLSTVLIAYVIGIPIGLIAGYRGAATDAILMRIMDAVLSFPSVILALALLATLGSSIRNVIIALGIVYTPLFARIARASTLSAREEDYVLAANSIGVSTGRLLLRHILPNIMAPILVQGTVMFATAIIAAASLSFLGVGTQPPTADWGRDISIGRQFIREAEWLIIAPSVAMCLTVLAINFVGDGLRDALDPTTRKTD